MARRGKRPAGMSPTAQATLFVEQAERLAALRVLQRTGSFNQLDISWRQGEDARMSTTEPDGEELDALLMRLRPFVLNDEPINLYVVHNMCERSLRSEELRGHLRVGRQAWSAFQRKGELGLRINDEDIPPEKAAHLVLYGSGVFHHGEREAWLSLGEVGQVLTRTVALHWVTETVLQVLHVRNVLKAALAQGLFDED